MIAAITHIKLRLRDKHEGELNRQARAVNLVWNYANETQQKAVRSGRKWLSWQDLQKLTAGSSKLLGLHAHTIQRVVQVYDYSRSRRKRPWLRFRGEKSLGWIPFNQGHVRVVSPGKLKFRGVVYETMHWREFPEGAVIHAGSFNRDSRGRWYVNLPVESSTDALVKSGNASIGIDLGLKCLATLSDGRKIETPRFYRKSEAALAAAQRAKKTKRVRAIHRKVKNRRNDFMHKLSAQLSKEYGLIVVGDISPSKMTRTRLAKSIADAGWHTFKEQLSYKAIRHGGRCLLVNETYSSQTCSSCGALPPERPKGIAGLGIREWQCSACGAIHDRDVNAALNILRHGLMTLEEGASQ